METDEYLDQYIAAMTRYDSELRHGVLTGGRAIPTTDLMTESVTSKTVFEFFTNNGFQNATELTDAAIDLLQKFSEVKNKFGSVSEMRQNAGLINVVLSQLEDSRIQPEESAQHYPAAKRACTYEFNSQGVTCAYGPFPWDDYEGHCYDRAVKNYDECLKG